MSSVSPVVHARIQDISHDNEVRKYIDTSAKKVEHQSQNLKTVY